MKAKGGIVAGLLGAAALLFAAAPSQAGEFDGVTVNVMTQTGAIQEPLARRAPEFEKLTGAKINVIAVPFSDLYQKVLTDWASGTNSVDAAVFAPQWMVDYVAGGYLEDIGARVKADKAIDWPDIAPFFRDFSSTYGGKTYLVPLDGDFHMLYYRTDLFEKAGLKAPTTWAEYLEDAKKLNGTDDGNGGKVYGSCIAKKRNAQSYWFVTDIVRLYGAVEGHGPGYFLRYKGHEASGQQRGFPQVARFSEGVRANTARRMSSTWTSGDTRPLFVSGKCALNLDWGDVGVLAIDPKASKVIDKTGSVVTPGSKEVLNWSHRTSLRSVHQGHLPQRRRWRQPRPLRCIWRLERRDQHQGEATRSRTPLTRILSYHVTTQAVERGRNDRQATGFNPYRTSQFELQPGMEKRRA